MKCLALILAVLMLLIFTSTPALAGIEPSPFQPEINQLNATVNMLDSIDHILNKTMDTPPIEGDSAHNINGALNKLEGIDDRLQSVGSMADSIFADIAAVMGTEPSPFNDPNLIAAFEAVKLAAEQIENTATRELPENVPQLFIGALGGVQDTVQMFVGEVQGYIDQLSEEPPTCEPSDIDEFACMENVNCEWITPTDPTSGPYCCCVPF